MLLACRMSRLPRVVIPDIPHHVTQRGNGRARTFLKARAKAEGGKVKCTVTVSVTVSDHRK